MNNKLVEEAPYHPGYEDAGFSKAKDRFSNYESICLQCGTTIYKPLQLTAEEINTEMLAYLNSKTMGLEDFARAILKKTSEK